MCGPQLVEPWWGEGGVIGGARDPAPPVSLTIMYIPNLDQKLLPTLSDLEKIKNKNPLHSRRLLVPNWVHFTLKFQNRICMFTFHKQISNQFHSQSETVNEMTLILKSRKSKACNELGSPKHYIRIEVKIYVTYHLKGTFVILKLPYISMLF